MPVCGVLAKGLHRFFLNLNVCVFFRLKLTMWETKEKILLLTNQPKALEFHVKELSEFFDVETAPNEQIAFFLIRESDIKLVAVDLTCGFGSHLPNLRKNFGYNIGIVGLCDSSSLQLDRAFRAGVDSVIETSQNERLLSYFFLALKKRMSRTKQVEERKNPERESTRAKIEFENIEIFPNDYLVYKDKKIIKTTPTQFRLLLSFLSKPNELLSRDWLQEHVWESSHISHRSIDAHVSKLKRQLPELGELIINIYGKGYMLNTVGFEENRKSA